MKRPVSRALLWLIAGYQRRISPAFPRRCRYEPTCSAYTAQAIRELGPARGLIVGGWRLLRCNPFSNGGIDDLADRRLFRTRPPRKALPAAGETGSTATDAVGARP